MSNNEIGCALLLFFAAMPFLLAFFMARTLLLLGWSKVSRLFGQQVP